MSVRKLAAVTISRNNESEFYPDGDESSKFLKEKLVQLIEWLLPPVWLHKFKKKGYIPLLGTKKKLIQECEIIKQQEIANNVQKKKVEKEEKAKRKKDGEGKSGNSKRKR